jgi:hypothetical protein
MERRDDTIPIEVEVVEVVYDEWKEGISKEEEPLDKDDKSCKWSMSKGGLLSIFIWCTVLFLGAFFILWLIQPTFVLDQPTNLINWGKLSLSSFIFALLGVIIIWIVLSCTYKS